MFITPNIVWFVKEDGRNDIIQEIKSISIVVSAELSVTMAYLLIPVISGYLFT